MLSGRLERFLQPRSIIVHLQSLEGVVERRFGKHGAAHDSPVAHVIYLRHDSSWLLWENGRINDANFNGQTSKRDLDVYLFRNPWFFPHEAPHGKTNIQDW